VFALRPIRRDSAPRSLRLAGLFCVAASLIGGAGGCYMAAGGNNVAGVHKFQQGQYQLALNDFQRALQNDPNNADAHYNLASVYHRLGKANGDRQMLEQAENLYNDCLNKCDATGGDHLECRRGLAVLLVEMDNADAAFRMLKNWSVEHPESAEPLVELARLYEEFGDKETARRQLEAAVQRDTTNARAFAALGRMHEQTGNTAQALADYQRSLQANRFQEGVAQRVAMLQNNLTGSTMIGPSPTRTVAGPQPRY